LKNINKKLSEQEKVNFVNTGEMDVQREGIKGNMNKGYKCSDETKRKMLAALKAIIQCIVDIGMKM
jgi:hypothetical protein